MTRLNCLGSPFWIEIRGRLAGFAIIDAGPGEHAEAQLTVPTRLFTRFDEGLSQWVWNPGIYRLHAGWLSQDLRVNTQVVLR